MKKEIIELIELTQKPQKEGYTIKEFAFISGLSPLAVKARIKRKTIRAVKDGNTYIIPAKEVNRFVFELRRS